MTVWHTYVQIMSVFIAISVVDTFALRRQFDELLKNILYDVPRIWFSLNYYNVACKLLQWIETLSQLCSAYFVLLFTLERFISVRFPLKRAVICTKRRVNVAIIIIVVIAALATVYEPYYYETVITGRGTTHLCHC